MLNRIVLIGRLVRDPDLRYTSSGTPVCNFTLAVERGFKNKNGDKEVDFIDIVAWRKLGETAAQHLNKGRLVAVDGRLQIRKSKKDGRTYVNPEVVAQDIRFLDWPGDEPQNAPDKHTEQKSDFGYNDQEQDTGGLNL